MMFFKKNFPRFKSNNSARNDNGRNRFKGSNFEKNKVGGFKSYQCEDENKENKLVGDFCY